MIQKALYLGGAIIFLLLAYVLIVLYNTYTQPVNEAGTSMSAQWGEVSTDKIDSSETLKFVIWNLGRGDLAAGATSASESQLIWNAKGLDASQSDSARAILRENIKGQLEAFQVDLMLLQEVDSSYKGSPGLVEYLIKTNESSTSVNYATTYRSSVTAGPLLEPWALYPERTGGLVTISKFAPINAQQIVLPFEETMWTNLSGERSSILMTSYRIQDRKEKLYVLNLHLHEYANTNTAEELVSTLQGVLLSLAKSGNYVIVGGSWGRVPAYFPYDKFIGDPDRDFMQQAVPADFPEAGWQYLFDATQPTWRSTLAPFDADSSFTTLRDFYLASPNVLAKNVRLLRQDFRYSNHQPVYLEVEFN